MRGAGGMSRALFLLRSDVLYAACVAVGGGLIVRCVLVGVACFV